MTAGSRLRIAGIALALGLAGAPAAAQNAIAPVSTSNEVVGPPQLQNFSLDGTVTRQGETPPPRQQQARPATAGTGQQATAPAPRQQAQRQEPETRQAPSRQPEQQPREAARAEAPASAAGAPARTGLSGGSLFDLPPPTEAPATTLTPALPGADLPPPDGADGTSSGFLSLPWLLALLAAAGAAVWYFRNHRPRIAFAGGTDDVPEPQPRPEPLQRAPAPEPAPPAPAPERPAAPVGIVSTRLRPWLDLSVTPLSCTVDDQGANIEFEVTVLNSGSGPARDVLLEAVIVNADPEQDKQIEGFFKRPPAPGKPIAAIPPLKSMTMRSGVSLAREQMRQFEVDGRKLFVPLLAFNAFYRNGDADAQTSAAYLVGRTGTGDRMAPFRLDQGPRRFGDLAARPLEPRIRR